MSKPVGHLVIPRDLGSVLGWCLADLIPHADRQKVRSSSHPPLGDRNIAHDAPWSQYYRA